VPQTIDCLQGILTIVPLQLLSYHLAVAKGCSAFLRRPWSLSFSNSF
jgi:glucosamine 6-phosphate synthetase-like amidotransferase/phosphosugar isomerase protein